MIRNVPQLLGWLADYAPMLMIKRAIYDGNVEFLGWFESIPGSIYPGWIVRVTSSLTNLSWNVVVRRLPFNVHRYRPWITGKIDWSTWNVHNSQNPLIQGDNYEIYKRLRENAVVGDGSEISSAELLHRSDTRADETLDFEGPDELQ